MDRRDQAEVAPTPNDAEADGSNVQRQRRERPEDDNDDGDDEDD